MDQKILIFISRILCYESNPFFISKICEQLQEGGFQTEVCEIDLEDVNIEKKLEQYIGKKFSAIIDFNSKLPRLEMDNGEKYLDQIDAPFYNYIVDHPLYHHPVIKIKLKRSNVICIDRKHCSYVKEYYKDIQNVFFMPLGAMSALNVIPYEKRKIDVLFSGTYTKPLKLLKEIKESDKSDQLIQFVEALKSNTRKTQEEVLLDMLKQSGKVLSREEFADELNTYYLAEKYVRAYYRDKMIQTLLAHGIEVTIYGYGWEKFESSEKEHLKVYHEVSYPVSLEIIADSKIVLNIMPWFKDGMHDRVVSAMINKAICVSDYSQYVDENFVDKKELILYSLDKLEELPEQIKMLLNNPERAKQISECGYKKVKENYMWKNMIQGYIEKIQ